MRSSSLQDVLPQQEMPEFAFLPVRGLGGEIPEPGKGGLEGMAARWRFQVTRVCEEDWYDGDEGYCERFAGVVLMGMEVKEVWRLEKGVV